MEDVKNLDIIMTPVGGGAFGANLGGSVWSKDKGADGAVADSEGLKSVDKMVDRLAYMLSTPAKDEMGTSGP